LQSFGLGHGLKLTMVGEGLPLRDLPRGVARFKYRFKPDPDWRAGYGTTGYVNGADALTFEADLATSAEVTRWGKAEEQTGDRQRRDEYYLTRSGEVNQLALAYPARDDTVLQLGTMSEPLLQMRECVDTIVRRQWGYDPVALESLGARPKLLNSEQMGSRFLQAMQRQRLGHNDAIHFRMDVDETGTASGCVVQHPRRGSEVEALICKALLESAEFQPAIDSSGVPVRAPYVSMVLFGIR
jgi:hypothetical protein